VAGGAIGALLLALALLASRRRAPRGAAASNIEHRRGE
jgi:hypothetical protein